MNNKEGEPKYIYHYLAQCVDGDGVKFTIDGIARMVERVETMDDYRDLKKLIIENESRGTTITISSLSMIGEL